MKLPNAKQEACDEYVCGAAICSECMDAGGKRWVSSRLLALCPSTS